MLLPWHWLEKFSTHSSFKFAINTHTCTLSPTKMKGKGGKKTLQHVCHCGWMMVMVTEPSSLKQPTVAKNIGISPFVLHLKTKVIVPVSRRRRLWILCAHVCFEAGKKELCGIAKETYCVQISIAFIWMALDSMFFILVRHEWACVFSSSRARASIIFGKCYLQCNKSEIRWKILHRVWSLCECMCVCTDFAYKWNGVEELEYMLCALGRCVCACRKEGKITLCHTVPTHALTRSVTPQPSAWLLCVQIFDVLCL